ncbi:MAG: DUF4231 domain-containing protein [Candidatus Eisenbacteria bacterium]|nr:DUF4231 domain-containing protein [Candidatus Latescibacterota bacterium]MBD3302863.1 DUF4231 domain-containing protein [Candidatus Eisenbacteria bacterium]
MKSESRTIVLAVVGHQRLSFTDSLQGAIRDVLVGLKGDHPHSAWEVVAAGDQGVEAGVVSLAEEVLNATKSVRPSPGKSVEQPRASARAGMMQNCDVLLAIWDGEPTTATSETALAVEQARDALLPLIWVHCAPAAGEAATPVSQDESASEAAATGRAIPASEEVTYERMDQVSLRREFRKHDLAALGHRKRRWYFAIFAMGLGPVAILLLSIQVVAFPSGGPWGILLILFELIALLIALATGYLRVDRSHRNWIRSRLRAELLRREMFLFDMRVGPYLRRDGNDRMRRAVQRLRDLGDEQANPILLLPLRESGQPWRDALEDAPPIQPENSLEQLCGQAERYLRARIAKQRDFFSRQSEGLTGKARRYENVAKLIISLALVIAAVHLGLLLSPPGDHTGGKSHDLPHRILVIFALFVPAVGSATIGLQSVTGSARLGRSYFVFDQTVKVHEKRLAGLVAHCRGGKTGDEAVDPSEERARLEKSFQRIILDVEQLLSSELMIWWMIMYSEEPRATA